MYKRQVMMKGRGYNRRFLRGRDGKPEPKVYAIVESNEINRNHLQFFGVHLSEKERNLAVMQIEGLLDTFIAVSYTHLDVYKRQR